MGVCDRTTGTCQCYDGHEGVACQRASCPNACSGNGVCKSKEQLAASDYGNVYLLWDKDLTMGCECDPGFTGPDCSLKECKHGIDPLYQDDSTIPRYSVFDFATLTTSTTSTFTDGTPQAGPGYWAIRFFDVFGEDWLTQPISAGASCDDVENALYNLPNDVIPAGTLECLLTARSNKAENRWNAIDTTVNVTGHTYHVFYNFSIWQAVSGANSGDPSTDSADALYLGSNAPGPTTPLSGYVYRIKFFGNPGAIAQPQIELYLDGKRPSLVSPSAKVITSVWTDGQQGEDDDFIADYCDNVVVTIANDGTNFYLDELTAAEKATLKKCLGGSDGDDSNNVDVYNWDTGSEAYPHLVKLNRYTNTFGEGSYYAALWFDPTRSLDSSGTGGTFLLVNPFQPTDVLSTDKYEIYTTRGILALTSQAASTVVSFASEYFYTVNSTFDNSLHNNGYDGDISCPYTQSAAGSSAPVTNCLNKDDYFTFLNWDTPYFNSPHINLYKAKNLYKADYSSSISSSALFASSTQPATNELHYMTNIIQADLSSNWGTGNSISATPFRIYKFTPNPASTYNYVNECSNRGICATDTGICACFPGYTSDDCSVQAAIAV